MKSKLKTSGKSALTPELEIDLCTRWRNGDRRAGNELVRRSAAFVTSVVLEYRRWGAPIDDLVQEGNIGLMKAAERFDPAHGARLLTYAAFWIRAQVREYVAQFYRIVRLGSSKAERKLLRLHRRSSERDPNVLAELSGLPPATVEKLLPILGAPEASLDNDDTTQHNRPSDAPSPEDALAAGEDGAYIEQAVRRALAGLPSREQALIEQRLLSEEVTTLEAFGELWGVSRERVRQLDERARERLRLALASDATILDIAPFVANAARHNGAQCQFVW